MVGSAEGFFPSRIPFPSLVHHASPLPVFPVHSQLPLLPFLTVTGRHFPPSGKEKQGQPARGSVTALQLLSLPSRRRMKTLMPPALARPSCFPSQLQEYRLSRDRHAAKFLRRPLPGLALKLNNARTQERKRGQAYCSPQRRALYSVRPWVHH